MSQPDPVAFVDLTVSLRLHGAPDDETVAGLARAAAVGGVGVAVVGVEGSALVDGPTVSAAVGALRAARALGVHLIPALTPVRGPGALADLRAAERAWREADAGDGGHGGHGGDVTMVWRLTEPTDDALLLRRIGDLARARGALVVLPSVDRSLSLGAVAVEGPVATRLGLSAMPEAAEAIGIARIVEVARLTGARFLVSGVFTAAGAALIADNAHLGVHGVVQAAHVLLDETALLKMPYDTRVLQTPPLPTAASREALLAAVKRGDLMLSSGHRHVPKRERDLEMNRASPGGTSLASSRRLLGAVLSPAELTLAASTGPAALLRCAPVLTATSAASMATVDDDLSILVSSLVPELPA